MKRKNLKHLFNQLESLLAEDGDENGILNLSEEFSQKVKGGYGNTNSGCTNSGCGSGGAANSACSNSTCDSDNNMTNTGCTNGTCS